MWDNDSSFSCWPLCIFKGGNQACCSWSFKHCVWGSKVIILHLYWNSQEMPKMKGQGQGQSKEQKSKNPNSSFSKSWSLARGSVRAPGRKYWKWTNSVDAQSCKCLFVQKEYKRASWWRRRRQAAHWGLAPGRRRYRSQRLFCQACCLSVSCHKCVLLFSLKVISSNLGVLTAEVNSFDPSSCFWSS